MTTTPLVKLCSLYENVSAKTGRTYFTGYFGAAKLIVLRDDRAEPGQPQWTMFIAERPPKPAGTAEPKEHRR